MDYPELKNKIFYSEAMRALHAKESPVGQYSDAGVYARDVQRYTDIWALEHGLNPDYCSVLALADVIGISGVAKLQEIAGEQIPEQLKKDLRDLESQNETMSNEAKLVQIVKNTLEAVSCMTKEEYEKKGGASLVTSILAGVKQEKGGIDTWQ